MECNGQDTLFVFLNNRDPYDFARTQCTLDYCFNVKLHELLKNDHVNICWGQAVAQLVEALRYKLEGRGFDSRWCHWIFSLT
jgi:hypothetical protein